MKKAYVPTLKTAGITALFVGMLAGGLLFYAAGQHNPQQEFHGAEWSSPLSWALVFLTGFAAGFVAAFAAVFGGLLGLKKLGYVKGHGATWKAPSDDTATGTQLPTTKVENAGS
jgi:hypothetical protein